MAHVRHAIQASATLRGTQLLLLTLLSYITVRVVFVVVVVLVVVAVVGVVVGVAVAVVDVWCCCSFVCSQGATC